MTYHLIPIRVIITLKCNESVGKRHREVEISEHSRDVGYSALN